MTNGKDGKTVLAVVCYLRGKPLPFLKSLPEVSETPCGLWTKRRCPVKGGFV